MVGLSAEGALGLLVRPRIFFGLSFVYPDVPHPSLVLHGRGGIDGGGWFAVEELCGSMVRRGVVIRVNRNGDGRRFEGF